MDPVRLDRLLVDRGLVPSRHRAERIIADHGVLVDDIEVRKPGKKVSPEAKLKMLEEDFPWVSRGALKLIAALDHFAPCMEDQVILDLGASTGGFTEVCLSRGARFVHAVDVGTGQLAHTLSRDDRVADLQQTHLKDLDGKALKPPPTVVVMDLSFISLDHVWHRLPQWTQPKGWGIALVKPQFEVGPQNLSRKGVVRNPAARQKALAHCINQAEQSGLVCSPPIDSPIEGGSGNREFLLHFTWDREN
ncbi:MAG: TlyA family rRNA (cytidine-2'-O)-methyltransferase [Crocinitomicaceae bacterium]|nr:TlyA family rRNA (cytidine-2'-O)-methyltransferase [Crocinitomicaceae bacterium]